MIWRGPADAAKVGALQATWVRSRFDAAWADAQAAAVETADFSVLRAPEHSEACWWGWGF